MKKVICTLISLILIFTATSCDQTKDNPSQTPSPTEQVSDVIAEEKETEIQTEENSEESTIDMSDDSDDSENSTLIPENVKIAFSVQEYIEPNIAEIPYFEYEGEKSETLESINRYYNQGFHQIYDDYMAEYNTNNTNWIEIKSYPFSSDEYLQVVSTYSEYPISCTLGSLVSSVNYDIANDMWLTIDDVIDMYSVDTDLVAQNVIDYIYEMLPDAEIGEILISAFLINAHNENTLTLFITTTVNELFTVYKYENETSDMYEVSYARLFGADEADLTEPPLSFTVESDFNGSEWNSDTSWYVEYEDGCWGPEFPDNVLYTEEYVSEGDPGENMTSKQAAATQVVNAISKIYKGSLAYLDSLDEIKITFTGFYLSNIKEFYQYTVDLPDDNTFIILVAYDGEIRQLLDDGDIITWGY